MPYPDFVDSLSCLDYKRLGKQRVEAKQILTALEPNSISRWKNHPAVLMWKGYEEYLKIYHNLSISEWISRGYNNNMPALEVIQYKLEVPDWFGNESFHASHRSNLLRKYPEHYSKFNWTEPNDLPYFWPTKEGY